MILIDGSNVKASDLNRVSAFCREDVGKPKVEALEQRLLRIRDDLDISSLRDSFRDEKELAQDYEIGWHVRDAVHDADVVFIATDTNTSRLAIEGLLQARPSTKSAMYLSCGVHVDRGAGIYFFECNWSPKTPEHAARNEGYGPENASYIAIVQEATAVSFSMLLSHLKSGDSHFKSYSRRYDANLIPVGTCVEGKSSNSKRPRQ